MFIFIQMYTPKCDQFNPIDMLQANADLAQNGKNLDFNAFPNIPIVLCNANKTLYTFKN